MAYAQVQGKSSSAQDASPTITFTSTPTANNLLCLVLGINGNETVSATPASFTLGPSGTDANGVQTLCYYKIASGSEAALTFTISGSTQWWSLGATEWSGNATASVLTTSVWAQSNGTANPTSGNTAGSASTGDLVVGFIGGSSFNASADSGSGFTHLVLSPAANQQYGTAFGSVGINEYRTDVSGVAAATFSMVTVGNYGVGCAVFAQGSTARNPIGPFVTSRRDLP